MFISACDFQKNETSKKVYKHNKADYLGVWKQHNTDSIIFARITNEDGFYELNRIVLKGQRSHHAMPMYENKHLGKLFATDPRGQLLVELDISRNKDTLYSKTVLQESRLYSKCTKNCEEIYAGVDIFHRTTKEVMAKHVECANLQSSYLHEYRDKKYRYSEDYRILSTKQKQEIETKFTPLFQKLNGCEKPTVIIGKNS